MAAAGGAGSDAAGLHGLTKSQKALFEAMERGNITWGNIEVDEKSASPLSEHLASSGKSSNRALFPTKKHRSAHYARKGALEEKKEGLRRAHWAKYYSGYGEENWAKREATRKTRKAAERNARRKLKKTAKSRSRQ